MARGSQYYRGKRKKRNRVLIPAAILLGLISLVVVLFYGMQKYVVITKDKIHIESPMLETAEDGTPIESEDALELETTDANVIFESPDYASVTQRAGNNLQPLRAIFVSADELLPANVQAYAERLMVGNALVLEMKPRTGALKWDSKAESAISYALAGNPLSVEMRGLLAQLKEDGVYLAAQISICRDELYAARCPAVTLHTAEGYSYMDEEGLWLDAYSPELLDYTETMCRELYAMGFDEVILADVAHPVLPEDVSVRYTREMSTTQSPTNEICGFAVSVADRLADREGKLSIYVDSQPALIGLDSASGQDGMLFFKLFDRVYYMTDRYAYTFNLADLQNRPISGSLSLRFVPVVYNYLPDNPDKVSWVLIDTETNK